MLGIGATPYYISIVNGQIASLPARTAADAFGRSPFAAAKRGGLLAAPAAALHDIFALTKGRVRSTVNTAR